MEEKKGYWVFVEESEVGVNGGKRRANEEISWFYTEKLGLPFLNSGSHLIAT